MIASLLLFGVLSQPAMVCSEAPAAEMIRQRRAGFNDAIRVGDIDGVADILADDVILVAGTHSDLFVGRAQQLEVWSDDFDSGSDRVIYRRVPHCITLSDVTEMAMEEGRWRGENPSGEFAAGRYTAKWRLINDSWELEAEVFMTEVCEGAFCAD